MLGGAIRIALQSIRRNMLRSFLTLLGIVIGVAAVIAMVTIGNGATEKIRTDLSKLGSNMLIVRPGTGTFGASGGDRREFHERDIDLMRQQIRNVHGIAPSATKSVRVVYGAANMESSIIGVDNSYLPIQSWGIASGRGFSDSEIRAGTPVCLIGETLRREFFGNRDGDGERIRVGKFSCDVIGVLATRGQGMFGNDQDNTVLMPLRLFQRRIAGNNRITTIYISVESAAMVPVVQGETEVLLRQMGRIAPGEDDDFVVRDMTQIMNTMTATTSLMTGLLGAVAGVSLLVGGIGIMNIMLVSVTERTREIGIRLAIGAMESQVLTQFLVEAVVLSLLGGIVGIIVGLGGAYVASHFMGTDFTIDVRIVVLAFGVSALIGVVFGFFPARRAARLDPIVALRHE